MGKPFGHEYHFAGGGSSKGLMVCDGCNQPIFNHAHDWLLAILRAIKSQVNHD